MKFQIATQVEQTGDMTFVAQVPESWEQGRGAFGGLVLGVLANAMEACEDDATRSLRVLSGEICGPVLPGSAQIEVSVLRKGNSLTNLDARLSQGGEVLARASSILARERPVDVSLQPTPPETPPMDSFPVIPIRPPIAPVFTQHYAFRVSGPAPFSGSDDARAEGWVLEADAQGPMTSARILGLLDSFWPTALVLDTTPRPMATISFTAQIVADLADLDGTQPLHFRSHAVSIGAGYLVEFRELWNGQALVALNQQMFAIIK